MCPRFARAEPNVTVVRELLLCPIGYIQTPSSLSACAHFSDVGRTKRRVDPAACGCMPCIHQIFPGRRRWSLGGAWGGAIGVRNQARNACSVYAGTRR